MRKFAITSGLVIGFVAVAGAIDLIPRAHLFNFDWLTAMAQPSHAKNTLNTNESESPVSIPKGVVTPSKGSINLIGDFDIAAPGVQADDSSSYECESKAVASDDDQDEPMIAPSIEDVDDIIAQADDEEVTPAELMKEAKKLREASARLERAAAKLMAKDRIGAAAPPVETPPSVMPPIETPPIEVPAMPDGKFEIKVPDFYFKEMEALRSGEELKALDALKLHDGALTYVFGFNDMDLVQRARDLALKNQKDKKVQSDWSKLASEWAKRSAEMAKNRKAHVIYGPMNKEQKKAFEQRMSELRSRLSRPARPEAPRSSSRPTKATSPRSSSSSGEGQTNAISIPVGNGASITIEVDSNLSSTVAEAN